MSTCNNAFIDIGYGLEDVLSSNFKKTPMGQKDLVQ